MRWGGNKAPAHRLLCPPTNCVDFAMWLLYNVYVRFQTAFTAE